MTAESSTSCPICGKTFERLSLMVDHVDQTYTLTRLIEEIIKAKQPSKEIPKEEDSDK